MSKKLFVISGPSGAGIGDVMAALFARRQDLGTVVPVTARKMKAGEVDGVGFYFYDLEGWSALKESGDLLECTEFAGNDYGTSRKLVEEQLAAGKHVLLSRELARAEQIKRSMPEAVCVYMAPSPAVLRERYGKIARSQRELAVRLEAAEEEERRSAFCDCRINSDDVAAAAAEMEALLDR